MPLILASTSPIRSRMLSAAGLEFDTIKPEVDEAEVKQRLADADTIALELAEAKTLSVSSKRPGDWVIGSDSVVSVGDRIYDKPADRNDAVRHLHSFSGNPMRLTSAVALARDGRVEWSHKDTALLRVRPLSEAFIAEYLDAEWPEVGYCVGVFRMEGRGVQLFDSVEGDHFTILGMPLLPLLGALRDRGLLGA